MRPWSAARTKTATRRRSPRRTPGPNRRSYRAFSASSRTSTLAVAAATPAAGGGLRRKAAECASGPPASKPPPPPSRRRPPPPGPACAGAASPVGSRRLTRCGRKASGDGFGTSESGDAPGPSSTSSRHSRSQQQARPPHPLPAAAPRLRASALLQPREDLPAEGRQAVVRRGVLSDRRRRGPGSRARGAQEVDGGAGEDAVVRRSLPRLCTTAS
jgi:hypothetical protein